MMIWCSLMIFTNLKCLSHFWVDSLLQNKNLSLVRYAKVDEHIIMHWLRRSIIQSMGANHKNSPHLTWHPLANLLAALSWVWKCSPFQACTNSSYWRFPQISHLKKKKKKHLTNLVAGWFKTFVLNTQRKCNCDCIVILRWIYTKKRTFWQLEPEKDDFQDQFHHQNSIDYQGAMVTKYDSCPRRAKALATWLSLLPVGKKTHQMTWAKETYFRPEQT